MLGACIIFSIKLSASLLKRKSSYSRCENFMEEQTHFLVHSTTASGSAIRVLPVIMNWFFSSLFRYVSLEVNIISVENIMFGFPDTQY